MGYLEVRAGGRLRRVGRNELPRASGRGQPPLLLVLSRHDDHHRKNRYCIVSVNVAGVETPLTEA